MTQTSYPRIVTSVLVEENPNSVVVTWGLGDRVETPASPEYFEYGVDYYGPDGNGGKRLGVRFGQKVAAYMFDWTDANQSNYEADSVTERADAIIVTFHDASLGVDEIGQITAHSHVDGVDTQMDLPVTVLR